jgi:hypothetical protein
MRCLGFCRKDFDNGRQGMDADQQARAEKKRQLLRELAELEIEEMADAGRFNQTAHFGAIERVASDLGKELSRETQERADREVAATGPSQATCPTCGALCDVTTKPRTVNSIDGPVELTESVADCRRCRRSFFPSTNSDGVG